MPEDERRPRRRITLGVSLKLYLDIAASTQWAREVATIANAHPAIRDGNVRLFVMPSLPAVSAVRAALRGTRVEVGAQNLHWADRGAFTGEVSGADLRSLGCTVVEVGHAERRALFGESDDIVRDKLTAAVRNDLVPVLCIGESERLPAPAASVACVAQLESALAGVTGANRTELIVAYEPTWAIGAAAPASASHVAAVAAALRGRLDADGRVDTFSIIYGGSAQRETLTDLGGAVDGLFLGRFAHDTTDLARIVDEAASLVETSRGDDEFAVGDDT